MTTLSLQSFTVVETSHHPQHWETAPSSDAGQIVRSNILLSLAGLPTVPVFTLNDVNLTPIVPEVI